MAIRIREQSHGFHSTKRKREKDVLHLFIEVATGLLNCHFVNVQVQQRYKAATGYLPFIFEGSSPGAGKFGYLRLRRRSSPKQN